MSKARDPLGKRALFSGAGGSGAESSGAGKREPEPVSAPRSAPAHRAGLLDITVECSACHEASTTSAPEIALKHLPVIAWLPWRKQSLLMRCPACGRMAWHRATRP